MDARSLFKRNRNIISSTKAWVIRCEECTTKAEFVEKVVTHRLNLLKKMSLMIFISHFHITWSVLAFLRIDMMKHFILLSKYCVILCLSHLSLSFIFFHTPLLESRWSQQNSKEKWRAKNRVRKVFKKNVSKKKKNSVK